MFDLLSEQYPCLDPLQEGIDDNSLIYQNFCGEAKRGILCEGEHYQVLHCLHIPEGNFYIHSYFLFSCLSFSLY